MAQSAAAAAALVGDLTIFEAYARVLLACASCTAARLLAQFGIFALSCLV